MIDRDFGVLFKKTQQEKEEKKVRKGILVLLFLVIMFSGAVYAEPPEIGTIILQPAPDSEVLDEVAVTILPDGGRIESFSKKIQDGESGGYDIQLDLENERYKAIKEEVPAEIKQEIEKQQKLNLLELDQPSISAVPTGKGKPTPPYYITRSVVAYLQTEDPVNIKTCSTFSNLHWTPELKTGKSSMWTWDANPSPVGTNWFTKRTRNYKVTTDELYANSHAWAFHYNYDFDILDFRTDVYHDVYVKGYFYAEFPSTATVWVNGRAHYDGEDWFLLHSHLYYYWGSQPIY